jgi:DNA (cytosine-5)-methyltransferase 1
MIAYTDVREIGVKTHGRTTNLICGGFPCQDVSLAGKRAGIAGERSGLWFEFARIIDELEPGWVIVENVPGLLSCNRGKDFAVIISWLANRGYGVAWRVLDAQYFGVPQRRRRVFIVGHFGDGRAAQVLFESTGGGGKTAQIRQTGQIVAETFTVRTGKIGGGKGYLGSTEKAMTLGGQNQWVIASGQSGAEITQNISPTLTANHEAPILAPGLRRLTPLECERLQGFPDGWTDGQSDAARYRQLGNAVAVPVVEWIAKRIISID